jgi:hypothetical protein
MLDKTLTGVLEISYQTIGGDWILDTSSDLTRLTNTQTNPRITTWEEVVDVPYQFPPIDHQWDLDDLRGVDDLIPILNDMTVAIRDSAGSNFAQHIADKANPHSVTKDQVGLDQVQNFPLANISEAQAGSLNTRYMTPVRTKNFVDSYMVPLLDTHRNDLNNPHAVTKAQVGLGSVLNYGVATQAEAEAGAVSNKYMTPLQTKQAIVALANAGLATHLADLNNPHSTTKAQVGLGSVENWPLANVAEAEAASRNDRYMTPLMTAKQIQVLVKDSMDLHINATNNPHLTTKAQVGLGNVQNYLIATQTEAEAGLSNTVYMTALMTRKAIEALASGSIGAHLSDNNNPHAVTKAQVGLSVVQNYSIASVAEAQAGTSNIRYMTPLLVKSAIDEWVLTDFTAHVGDKNNPHAVTAAQVGTYTSGTLDTKFLAKLDKTAQAADSALLEGHTYQQTLTAAQAQKAADSFKLEGRSLAQIYAEIDAAGVANSFKLAGKTLDEIVQSIQIAGVDNANQLEGRSLDQVVSYAEILIPYTRQLLVPNYVLANDATYKWVPIMMASPQAGDTEDMTVMFNGLVSANNQSVTGIINIDPVDLGASVTILSGNVSNLELMYTKVAGVFRLWYKTNAKFATTTLTVVSGKDYITIDKTATVMTTQPAGSVVIPVAGNTADIETLVTTLTTSFTSATAALQAIG